MGFTTEQAEFALKQPANAGSPDAAVMWLFSNMDNLPTLMAAAAVAEAAAVSGASKMNDASAMFAAAKEEDEIAGRSREGKYQLVGFISHVGKTTGSGHYVCHIKKNVGGDVTGGTEGKEGKEKDVRWVIHNDRKVAVSQNPPKEHGYLYLYKHV